MTNISIKPTNNTLTKEEISEIVEIMAKILKVPEQDIIGSIKLFQNIDTDMKNCLDRMCKIKRSDYITACMLLEYLLTFGGSCANEIISS